MYGKIFEFMYDGSLYGQWEAIVTFQQMIVLADLEGFIDMTPPALSARTSIPLEIIKKGIEILENNDPYTRTAGEDGRRIIRIDESRPWGWQIINYKKYRDMASQEDRRKYMREYMKERREQEKLAQGEKPPCAYCGEESHALDHIIPKILGGDESELNIVNCCKSCNSSKRDTELVLWLTNKNKINIKANIETAIKNEKIKNIIKEYIIDKKSPLTLVNICKQFVTDVTHTDTDTDTDKNSYSENSLSIIFSNLLYTLILKNNSNFKKPNLQAWAKHIDLMIRTDKRSPEEIKKVIEWSQQDEFWHTNILSTAKLRKQYDQLVIKMRASKKEKKESSHYNFPECGSCGARASSIKKGKECSFCGGIA